MKKISPPSPITKPIFDEALRREKVIKDIVSKMTFKVGDVVKPVAPREQFVYGNDILVEKVCDSYGKYGKNEKWPEHDNPLLVHAYSRTKDTRFTCTVNFLQKV